MFTRSAFRAFSGPLLALSIVGVNSHVSQAGTILDYTGFAQASNYNAYILGDIEDYSNEGEDQTDIEGAVAVAGDVKSTGGEHPSLTIGYKLSQQPGYDPTQTNLIVGGSLDNGSNTVHGSVWVGGDANLGSGLTVDGNVTVTGSLNYNEGGTGGEIGKAISDDGGEAAVLTGDNATFGHGSNVYGSVHANGSVTVNGDGMGDTTAITEGGGQPIPASPIDFVAMDGALKADSTAMSNLDSNALVQQDVTGHWGVLLDTSTTSAADGDVIVFDLGVDIDYLWQNGFSIESEDNVEIVINVAGGSHTITNFGFFVDPVISLSNIVFNFYEATEIFLGTEDNSSGIGFMGNIFAPWADVHFYNGLLEGNLIAKNLTGNGQINWMYQSDPQSVPAPTPILLVLFGLLGIYALRLRRRSI